MIKMNSKNRHWLLMSAFDYNMTITLRGFDVEDIFQQVVEKVGTKARISPLYSTKWDYNSPLDMTMTFIGYFNDKSASFTLFWDLVYERERSMSVLIVEDRDGEFIGEIKV